MGKAQAAAEERARVWFARKRRGDEPGEGEEGGGQAEAVERGFERGGGSWRGVEAGGDVQEVAAGFLAL